MNDIPWKIDVSSGDAEVGDEEEEEADAGERGFEGCLGHASADSSKLSKLRTSSLLLFADVWPLFRMPVRRIESTKSSKTCHYTNAHNHEHTAVAKADFSARQAIYQIFSGRLVGSHRVRKSVYLREERSTECFLLTTTSKVQSSANEGLFGLTG